MSDISRAASVRRNMGLGALVAGPIAITVASLIQVDTGDNGGMREIVAVAAHRGRFYASGILFGLGIALVAVGIGQVYRLVDRRGSVWTTVGGLMMQVGGMLAAAAITIWTLAVTVASYDSLNRTAMAQWDHTVNNSGASGWPWLGFIAFSAGGLVLGVGLLRARTVPIWQPILVMAGVVIVFFVNTSNNLASALTGLPLVVGLLALAWSISRLREPAAMPSIDLTQQEVPFPRTATETAPTEQPSTN